MLIRRSRKSRSITLPGRRLPSTSIVPFPASTKTLYIWCLPVADIAGERKANLVVAKAAVLFEAPELDITQEVIKRLDVKLPQVQLATPQIAPNAAPANAAPVNVPPSAGGTTLPLPQPPR